MKSFAVEAKTEKTNFKNFQIESINEAIIYE